MRHLFVASLAILAVLQPPAAAGMGGATPFRIVPGAYDKKAGERATGAAGPATGRVGLKGLSVAVEHLDPQARAAFARSIDPASPDPFGVPPGRPEFYTTFLVEFENQSGREVLFQPGNVALVTDRGEQQFPVDLTDLYRAAALREAEDPEATMRRIAPLIFDSSVTIQTGRRLSRLLVFGPLPPKWKEIRLLFSFLHIGSETDTVSLTFHKQVIGG